MLKDPATWRDLLWLLVDMTAGLSWRLLRGRAAPLSGWRVLGPGRPGLWRVFADDGRILVRVRAGRQPGVRGLLAAAARRGSDRVGSGRRPGAAARPLPCSPGALLAPTQDEELAQRVERLTETRHDAVDTSAAELRRIERDLHDGAQARLVAMGMNLGTIEALIEKDPAQAKELLAQARESSAEALTELRDLVRGIHPPVLAERGLGDAVRALALRLPVATEVERGPARPAGGAGGVGRVLRGQRGRSPTRPSTPAPTGSGSTSDHARRHAARSRSPTTARAAPIRRGHRAARHRAPARYIRRRPGRQQSRRAVPPW